MSVLQQDSSTSFNLEPPEAKPSNMDILASWDIKPRWEKEDKLWYLPGLGYLHEILEMDEEELQRLTSRDRHAVNKALEDYGDYLGSCYLDDNVWQSELGWYARHMDRSRGPTINVKLYETWDLWRTMESIFGVSLEEHEVDPQYVAWNDSIEHEMDWFKSEYIDGEYPGYQHLDGDRFVRGGRSGGWLVYEINTALTLGAATELRKVWADVPSFVTECAREVVARQWAWGLEKLWDDAVDEWREREEETKSEAVRTNDIQAAARHQANLDERVHMFSPDFFDLAWEKLYEAVSDKE